MKNVSEDNPVSVAINNGTGIFPLVSYICGYYVYIKVWNDTINDSLQCKIKENNKFDPSAVALIHDDGIKQKVVGLAPFHISKIFCRFLKLLDCSTLAMVAGK